MEIDIQNHFLRLRPQVKEVFLTKHFKRDVKDVYEEESLIRSVMDSSHEDFTELHKFEEKINDMSIFRAKRGTHHIVYCIDGQRLVFLRMVRNFEEYRLFLEEKKEIEAMARSQNLISFKWV